MLVEHGFVRAQLPDGREWTFTPSLGRIAELGTPAGIVELYAALHGPRAPRLAREVLAGLCDQQEEWPVAAPLIGWLDWDAGTEHDGAMPVAERVVLARHLMQHGISGKPDAAKAADGGSYSSTFDAAQFIAMARVHLGMTQAEAAALSMTELQQLMAVKFPPQDGPKAKNVPSRAEYEAAMKRFKERRGE